MGIRITPLTVSADGAFIVKDPVVAASGVAGVTVTVADGSVSDAAGGRGGLGGRGGDGGMLGDPDKAIGSGIGGDGAGLGGSGDGGGLGSSGGVGELESGVDGGEGLGGGGDG